MHVHTTTLSCKLTYVVDPVSRHGALLVTSPCAGSGVAPALVERGLGSAARAQHTSPSREFPLQASGRYYSISHSADLTGVAIATCPVGLDIEARLPISAPADLAWTLTEEELSEVADAPTRLTEIWTTKEAAGKALGTGLAVRPYCFHTSPAGGDGISRLSRIRLPAREEVQVQTAGWWFGDRHIRVAWHEPIQPSSLLRLGAAGHDMSDPGWES